MTNQQIHLNSGTLAIEGQIDLNSSAAVIANRGDHQTAAKTGTGVYTVTIPASLGITFSAILSQSANYCNTVPATALGVRVSAVALDSSGNLVITITTSSAATSGSDTNGTAATTISFRVLLQVWKMTSSL